MVLVCGVFRANARYFYCETMGLMAEDPCAVDSTFDDVDEAPSFPAVREHREDCCQVLQLSAMPAGTMHAEPSVPPSPVSGFVTASRFIYVSVALARSRHRSFERWRLPPPPPGAARAQLMVFLT